MRSTFDFLPRRQPIRPESVLCRSDGLNSEPHHVSLLKKSILIAEDQENLGGVWTTQSAYSSWTVDDLTCDTALRHEFHFLRLAHWPTQCSRSQNLHEDNQFIEQSNNVSEILTDIIRYYLSNVNSLEQSG